MIKEKRAPSRSLSLWAYPGLLIVMLVSYTLTGWCAQFNPWTNKIYFDEYSIYWDQTEDALVFFSFWPSVFDLHRRYHLNENGTLTRTWQYGDGDITPPWRLQREGPVYSLTEAQLAEFEDHYGEITGYSVVNSELTALIVKYDPPLQNFYSHKLILIKDSNVDTAQIIDTARLFQADMETDNNQLELGTRILLLVGALSLSFMGIRKLPYKYMALLMYVLGLVFMFWMGLGIQGWD